MNTTHPEAAAPLRCPMQGEEIPMVVDYRVLRQVSKDWKQFSSDVPFRVPIPSEEEDRSVRQLPIERDPPLHSEYRKLVDAWFKRPRSAEFQQELSRLIGEQLTPRINGEAFAAIHDLALPIQSLALTKLLGVPESESERWISWGTHVFHSNTGEHHGQALEDYLNEQFDRAEQEGGEDFFALLSGCEFQGRRLSREELLGFGNLAFAGGRDTVINSICGLLGHVAEHPEDLERLRAEPTLRAGALEELFRWISPVTQIGRVCPHGATLQGLEVPPMGRVSLNWARANRDPKVFPDPNHLDIARMPNPHVAFGSGPHSCIGATHARALLRCLLDILCEQKLRVEILEASREHAPSPYHNANIYRKLKIRLRSSGI